MLVVNSTLTRNAQVSVLAKHPYEVVDWQVVEGQRGHTGLKVNEKCRRGLSSDLTYTITRNSDDYTFIIFICYLLHLYRMSFIVYTLYTHLYMRCIVLIYYALHNTNIVLIRYLFDYYSILLVLIFLLY